MHISDITATDLQDEIITPVIFEEYRNQVIKGMESRGFLNISAGYIRSLFQDFESYLKAEVDLDEDDVLVVLNKYISKFFTYELQPGIYTFKDIPKVLFNILQS